MSPKRNTLWQIAFVLVAVSVALTARAKEPAAAHSQWVYLDALANSSTKTSRQATELSIFLMQDTWVWRCCIAQFPSEENSRSTRGTVIGKDADL